MRRSARVRVNILYSTARTYTITGLPDEPAIHEENGGVTVKADGVQGEFKSAHVTRDGRAITITLQ